MAVSRHKLMILLSVLIPMVLVTVGTVVLVAGTGEYRLPLVKTGRYTEDRHIIHVRGLIDMVIYTPGFRGPVYGVRGRANISLNTARGTASGEAYNPRSGATALSYHADLVYLSATSYQAISTSSLLYILGLFAGIAGTAVIVYKGEGEEVYLALLPLMAAIMGFALALLLARMTGTIIPVGGGGGGGVA